MENPVQMLRTFPEVDPAKVKSGHTVYVFNIRRNEFRLIAAVHFDQGRLFTLRFLTHAEYDHNQWKEEL
ncbi:MAG TPA: type II toxin-antitoxin system HigB family toxin [Chthoniobacteraceae bacterium]|nr:type II toxin-antitoxin system HigB family toxin [Chthoniobacteraceae bacterium]